MDCIVWMDLELTGLNMDVDKILEISCLITNKDLELIAEAPTQCIYQPENVLNEIDDWCKNNLGGLLNLCRNSSINIEDAEENLLIFLKKNVPKKACPLGGNTIYMDRLFIMKFMPKLNEYLHYRIIDVSSIKELCKRWNPSIYNGAPEKKLSHRSLSDIKETINELKYYKKFFLVE